MVATKEIPTVAMFFCHRSAMFWPICMLEFNGWNRRGLRRIVSTVAMVTSNTANF